MKRGFLLAVLLSFMLVIPALPLQAQVSFSQFPTYAGSGTVFVADFNGDGKPDVLCSDGTMNLGNGDGTFRLGTPVSGTPLAVADFNGDGRPDILEQGIVLMGNGDGTFQSPITTQVGASIMAAVDLNGDGKADVVGLLNSSLLVYLSKGDATFVSGVPYNLGATTDAGTLLSLGDFNGDNRTDVVVSTDTNNGPGQEIVLLGNGDGTFQTAKASSGVYAPGSVAVGNFNGDGKLGLAVTESCAVGCPNPGTVNILLGNGDGTFQAPTVVFTGAGPLIAADVNGDGKIDLILQGDRNEAQIYLGNGDGTFSNISNYVLSLIVQGPFQGYGGVGMAVADLNADGKLDIAAGNGVLLGNGNGTFQGIPMSLVPNGLPTTAGGPAAVIGRFDNAGAPGVALLANGGVSIFTNDGSGALSLAHTYPLQGVPSNIVTGDFNGDGNLDLAVIGTEIVVTLYHIDSILTYSVLLGNGDGSFQSPVLYSLQAECYCLISAAVGDFNNDGTPDLAVAMMSSSGDALFVLLGNGDGTFAAPISYWDIGGLDPLLVADFNGDGKLDIVAGGNSGTAILFGNGDGTFQPAVFPPNLSDFSPQLTADINNDGRPDLVSSNQVALGNGDGNFTLLPQLFPPPSFVLRPLAVDFNGDGNLDLVATIYNVYGQPVQTGILLGNGDGTFGAMINVPTSGVLPPGLLLVADMNGDGRPDIVFPGTLGYGVLLNTTPPGFKLLASALSPATIAMGNSATSTVTAIPMFGFNNAVSLSCPGLPSGASCAFNPPTIANSSGMSMLTITTTTSIAAGAYPVQVQGSAGTITKSTTLSLVVQAPDFSVGMASGTPTSQTISAGQTANFNLVITPSGSFTGEVNLSCGITPVVTPAPTCTLSSSSVQVSGSSAQPVTATVGTTASVTTGAASYAHFPPTAMSLACMSILLSAAWFWMWNRKRLPILGLPLTALALAFCLSCGGGGSTSRHITPGTPAGTYTATVTASSGALSHSTALQLVVQ